MDFVPYSKKDFENFVNCFIYSHKLQNLNYENDLEGTFCINLITIAKNSNCSIQKKMVYTNKLSYISYTISKQLKQTSKFLHLGKLETHKSYMSHKKVFNSTRIYLIG